MSERRWVPNGYRPRAKWVDGERTVSDREYIDWYDTRFDLARTIGLIVPPPSGLSSAAFDADDHMRITDALIARVQSDALARCPLPDAPTVDTRPVVYQDGPPRAGGDGTFLPTMFMFLMNEVVPVVGSLEATYRVGKWVLDVYRTLATLETDSGAPLYSEAGSRLGITPQGIRAACLAHAIDEYHLTPDSVSLNAFTRDVFFGNAGHPTTSMNTTVYVTTRSGEHYIYVVSGNGVVVEHSHIAGDTVTPLQVPKGLEYFGLPELATSEASETIIAGPVEVG